MIMNTFRQSLLAGTLPALFLCGPHRACGQDAEAAASGGNQNPAALSRYQSLVQTYERMKMPGSTLTNRWPIGVGSRDQTPRDSDAKRAMDALATVGHIAGWTRPEQPAITPHRPIDPYPYRVRSGNPYSRPVYVPVPSYIPTPRPVPMSSPVSGFRSVGRIGRIGGFFAALFGLGVWGASRSR